MLSRLQSYLDEYNVSYETIKHPVAFSALQLCEVSHIPSQDLAKTVICKTPNKMFMVVLRAHDQINMNALSEALGVPVTLASEAEFDEKFPDCETGAMPPFGNLYDMDVYVSDDLVDDHPIAFNAGNHSELVKLKYQDYENLVHPKKIHFEP